MPGVFLCTLLRVGGSAAGARAARRTGASGKIYFEGCAWAIRRRGRRRGASLIDDKPDDEAYNYHEKDHKDRVRSRVVIVHTCYG